MGTDRHCRGPRRARLLAAALAARDFSLATPHPDGRGEPHRLSPQRVVKVNGSRGRCIRASAIGASAHPPVPTARRAQPRDKQRTEVRRAGRHAHAGWRRLSFRFRTRWRQRCEPTLPCFRRYRDGSALPTAAPRTLQRLGGTPPRERRPGSHGRALRRAGVPPVQQRSPAIPRAQRTGATPWLLRPCPIEVGRVRRPKATGLGRHPPSGRVLVRGPTVIEAHAVMVNQPLGSRQLGAAAAGRRNAGGRPRCYRPEHRTPAIVQPFLGKTRGWHCRYHPRRYPRSLLCPLASPCLKSLDHDHPPACPNPAMPSCTDQVVWNNEPSTAGLHRCAASPLKRAGSELVPPK